LVFLLRRIDVVATVVAFVVLTVADDCAEGDAAMALLLLLLLLLSALEVLRGRSYPLSSCGKPLHEILSGLTLFPTANLNPVGGGVLDNAGDDDVAMVDSDDEETGFVVDVADALVVVVDGGNATTELPPANDLVPGRNLTEFGTATTAVVVVVVVVRPSAAAPPALVVGVIPMDEPPDNDALLHAILAAK
jgi:hypothetical protein